MKPGSELSALFHKAWGQAKASPEYDKSVWLALEREIRSQPPAASGANDCSRFSHDRLRRQGGK